VGPLTPDQIVYAGLLPLFVDARRPALRRISSSRTVTAAIAGLAGTESGMPAVVIVRGLGLFAVADTAALADTVSPGLLDAATVSVEAHRMGGVRPLSAAERGFIERWEAESYRKGVAAGGPVAGRAKGLSSS